MIKEIEKFRDEWDSQELKDEIDKRIIYPLQDFEDFLRQEITRHAHNNEYPAMYALEAVLEKFQEASP